MGGHAALVAHLFVRPGLPITAIGELRGRRLAVQPPGSPGAEVSRAILEAYQLGPRELDVVTLEIPEQIRAFREGTVDAALMVVPVSSPVVTSPGPLRLTRDHRARLLSLDSAQVTRVLQQDPSSSWHRIPAGTYAGQSEAVLSIAHKNAVIAHKDLDPVLVYQFVRAILEHPQEFRKVCPLGVEYTPDNVTPGSRLLPVHVGAQRYFQEKGIRTPFDASSSRHAPIGRSTAR